MRKKSYSTIKYHEYIIQGMGLRYDLYHPLGFVGSFPTCKEAKAYVDADRRESDNRWNAAVLADEEV